MQNFSSRVRIPPFPLWAVGEMASRRALDSESSVRNPHSLPYNKGGILGYYNFSADLKISKEVEREIAKALSEKYDVEIIGELNDTATWDFQMRFNKDNKIVSVEVKQDFKAKDTGNIVVEYECRGKPSGISSTKSDYYLYRVHQSDGIRHYLMETSKLKEIIGAELYFRIVNGGDKGSNTKMYLFKLDVFTKYAWTLGL